MHYPLPYRLRMVGFCFACMFPREGNMQVVVGVLEVHLEAELQDPGRIRSSDGSKSGGAQSRAGVGDAGSVAVDGAARVGVVGVVEAVEALGTGFELQSLMQRGQFAESRVHVGVMRSVELIGPGLAI